MITVARRVRVLTTCDVCGSGVASSNAEVRIVHEMKGRERFGRTSVEMAIRISDGHIRDCRRRRKWLRIRSMKATSGGCKFPCVALGDTFGTSVGIPSIQPSLGSTPYQASVHRERTKRTCNLTGDVLSDSSPKVTVVEAAEWRFLLLLLLGFSGPSRSGR